MSYRPGGSPVNAYSPFASVVSVCSPDGPRSCMAARGIRAPEGSVMIPRRLAGGGF